MFNAISPVQATGPAPLPQSQHGQLRSNLVPYSFGPSSTLPPNMMPSFPPPVQVPASTGLSIEMQVLPSPRKDHRIHVDDGVRSPMPAPPGQISYPKAAERAPHSARTGIVFGNPGLVGMRAAELRNGETWGQSVRWEQASPCRMRFIGTATGRAPQGTLSAGAPGRQVLGPPPKAAPPGASLPRSAAPLAQMHVVALTSKSPVKSIRAQK